jgi:hypothetical protein
VFGLEIEESGDVGVVLDASLMCWDDEAVEMGICRSWFLWRGRNP